MNRPALLLTAFAGLFAVSAHAETVKLHATMSPQSEVPPKDTHGSGTFDGMLDTSTKVLTYTLTYTDLTGPATMAHIHGPAATGANAGVLVPFPAPLTSPIKGTLTLTDAQVTDVMDGKTYANVHTDANKGGELRGQITK